jgi:hypothetical protein
LDLWDAAKKIDPTGIVGVAKSCTENAVECTKSAMELASIFDPTGILTIAAAFVMPTCDVDYVGENKDARQYLKDFKNFFKNCGFTNYMNSDAASRSVAYLDRLPIACASHQLLNAFKFNYESKYNMMKASYRCITPAYSPYNCRGQATNWNEFRWGAGDINYLDRHPVDCGYDYLQSIKLVLSGSSMRYEYTCCSAHYSTPILNSFLTNKGPVVGWHIDQFEPIDALEAGPRGALSSFKVNAEYNPDKFWYEYRIGNLDTMGDNSGYYDKSTNWNDAGEGSVWFLERHNLMCDYPNSAMTSFKYERNGDGIRYVFKCIQNNKISNSCSTNYTKWKDVGGYEKEAIHYLDRHLVACPVHTTLRGFVIRRQDAPGNLLRYEYTCCQTEYSKTIANRTERTSMGNRNTFYLDRQRFLPLGPDEALQSFKLETKFDPDELDYYFTSALLY